MLARSPRRAPRRMLPTLPHLNRPRTLVMSWLWLRRMSFRLRQTSTLSDRLRSSIAQSF
uniref:Uncharacterized protein n=1 Tax=uncultured marine virus TaxID=186617 RepID=A0A0F7L7V9_9VIRU|nr:hypothetical protein [uncultured marine virus]